MTGICPGRAIWGYSPLERREGHPDLAMPMKALKSRLLDIHEVTGGKFGPGFSAVKLDHPRRIRRCWGWNKSETRSFWSCSYSREKDSHCECYLFRTYDRGFD